MTLKYNFYGILKMYDSSVICTCTYVRTDYHIEINMNIHKNLYIHIYMCVCVCVCASILCMYIHTSIGFMHAYMSDCRIVCVCVRYTYCIAIFCESIYFANGYTA